MNKQIRNSFILTGLILIFSLMGRWDKISLQERNVVPQTNTLAAVVQPALVDPVINRDSFSQQKLMENIPVSVTLPKKNPDTPALTLQSQAALAIDLDSGAELFNFNGYSNWPIASLTKLMTSIVALEGIGKIKNIPISENAFNTEGTTGGFKSGELYSAEDLIKAMMTVSSNDAAEALAEFYDKNNFISGMQKKASELSMVQTMFTDPTGLSFLNQSSAADLVKLVKYVLAGHPELLEMTTKKTAEISEINSSQKRVLNNINLFAGREDFLGGKTGFIDASGSNLISIFLHKNHKLLLIIFGAKNRFEQTELLYNWIKSAYTF